MGLVIGLRGWFDRRPRGRVSESVLHERVTWAVLTAALIAAVILVRHTRLMWDDFILVLLALLVHGKIEHGLTHAYHRLRHLANPRHSTAQEPHGR